MGSPDVLPHFFESLPHKPPTPPREAQRDIPAQKNQLLIGRAVEVRANLQTPPGVYSPDSINADSSNRRAGKKVGFSAQADYKDPPAYEDGNGKVAQHTPVSLPSSTSRPAKSILKVAQSVAPPNSSLDPAIGTEGPSTNIVEMLQSTVQQLAGADRTSRLDAYMMLVRALKTSNNLPDRVALQEKMSLFMQFMQRDMAAKTPAGTLDASMVNHSLTLLITFLHFPAIASTLSNEFAAFVLDYCVRCFEDETVPKDVIRHLMQVVARQNFSAKVMTSDRVGRLVKALNGIEVQGKSIVMARIVIYDKMIRQARQHMIVHNDWLFDIFTDLLSSLKEIRAAAIDLGLEAAFAMGREKSMLRKVTEVLNKTSGEQSYIEYYIEVLDSMTKRKADSASVPQIWSVVVLFLPHHLEKWDFFDPWLRIIQKCFNSGDLQTKLEANRAWGRLVYHMQRDERVLIKHLQTLTTPLITQLRRKSSGKPLDELRTAVLGGVCNLYYYVFKPNSNPASTLLDAFWDQSVEPLMFLLITREGEASADCLAQATAILTGLFDCATPRLWKDDRVLDLAAVRPDELPAIDAKWLRRSADRVFRVVAPIMERNVLELAKPDSATHKLWRALVASVASAAAKEVKVSLDTAAFIAESFNLLYKLWSETSQTLVHERQDSYSQFLSAIHEYLSIMTTSLGLLPFTSKILAVNQAKAFAPYATPSRSSRAEGRPSAPLYHAFGILSCLPSGASDDDDLATFIQATFRPFFTAKSATAKAMLAQELLSSIPMDTLLPYGPWVMVSEMICDMLKADSVSQVSTTSSSESSVGQHYRDVVKVLERGLRSTPGLPWPHWEKLFRTVHEAAKSETGDAGFVMSVAESLSLVILSTLPAASDEPIPTSILASATAILSTVSPPKDERAVDAARRRLWGTSAAGPRVDILGHMYDLANKVMMQLYATASPPISEHAVSAFLAALDGLLGRCHGEQLFKTVTAIQAGLECWVRDQQKQLNQAEQSAVVAAVLSIWQRVCQLLAGKTLLQPSILSSLEPLLCAGFQSTHRTVVNNLCTVWNAAFESADPVEYPDKLRCVLIALAAHVDIVLPGLEGSSLDSRDERNRLVERQVDLDLQEEATSRPGHIEKAKARPHSRFMPSAAVLSAASGSPQDRTGRPGGAAPSRAARTPRRSPAIRLRHDDSQLQFAPITSSPNSLSRADSQLLTDRQKEVRDQQKANAALFPDIRSSPGENKPLDTPLAPAIQEPADAEQSLEAPGEATPALEGDYEAFATSTPTPRRGQPLLLQSIDNEGADPPSSPPEPRRTPLFAEMQPSRSASQSLLDEWQFSSSPISGSPNPLRQVATLDANMGATDLQLTDVDVDDEVEDQATSDGAAVGESHVVDEQADELPEAAQGLEIHAAEAERPTTPSQLAVPVLQETASTPSRQMGSVQETPRSGNEVFVDALTSPVERTPQQPDVDVTKGAQPPAAPGQSFEASDVDESGLLRLVVELDGGQGGKQGDFPAVSVSPGMQDETLDCIVVSDGSKKRRRRKASTRSMSSPSDRRAATLEPQDAVAAENAGGRKRKRQAAAPGEMECRKQQRTSTADGHDGALPDGQEVAAGNRIRRRSDGILWKAGAIPSPGPAERQSSPLPEITEAEHQSPDSNLDPTPALDPEAQEDAPDSSPGVVVPGDAGGSQAPVTETEQGGQGSDAEAVDSSQVQDVPVMTEEQPKGLEGILSILGSGIDHLRGVRLSRQEVYKIEDVLMDIKRELYEAESRGRT